MLSCSISNLGACLRTVEPNSKLFRIYNKNFTPLFFGSRDKNYEKPVPQRFDFLEENFGVCYFGQSFRAAFVETALHFGPSDPSIFSPEESICLKTPLLEELFLKERNIAEYSPVKPLKLIDLSGSNLRKLGLTARIFGEREDNYKKSRQWADQFYRNCSEADGILYPCCHDISQKAVALFHRAEEGIRLHNEVQLEEHDSFNAMLDKYNVTLIGSSF